MNVTVPIALYGWPIVVFCLFFVLPPRRAVLFGFIFAWLMLPVASIQFQGLPAYTKMSATVYGTLLGALLFDSARVFRFRFAWIDLAAIAFCVIPMLSSLSNGLGAYDGLSASFSAVVDWGIPYFLGRLYFSDLEGLRDLAMGVLVGAALYVPLCLFEMRMSPRLHIWIYGYHQHIWSQTSRFGGWRPTVFMQHGLAVALWMTAGSLVAIWFAYTRVVTRMFGMPIQLLAGVMTGTAVFCRSAGATALLILGGAAYLGLARMKSTTLIAVMIFTPVAYMTTRSLGLWDGSQLVDLVSVSFRGDRTGSLQYRLDAETLLAEHALRRPWLGWGGWSRNRPAAMGYEADNLSTDGLWIITLGQRGLLGLASMTVLIIAPALLVWKRMPLRAWIDPQTAHVGALALSLALFMIDCLFNAMLNPIFLLVAGGVGGFATLALARPLATPQAIGRSLVPVLER